VFAALILFLALGPGWVAWADGPGNTPTAAEVSTRFGVVEAYFRPEDARELGVGWERIVFEWPRFQPDGPDQFDTTAIPEEWLRAARDGGRDVVGILKNVPYWASGGDLLGLPPTGLDLPIDAPANYWAAFVARAVRYYGETWGITHWIIFNEPDIRPGEMDYYEFDGEVADYYQMLKVAYLAAKAVNPEVTIHLAGMAWWGDKAAYRLPYLQRLLYVASNDSEARAHGFFFDVVMVHTYFGTSNVWTMLQDTRDILAEFGLANKPIWIDETNASPSLDPAALPCDAPYRVTLSQQADFIVQAAALSLAAGVERFAIYRLYDNHYAPGQMPWGLVRVDGTRRPAFARYRDIIRLFEPTERASYLFSDHASLVRLEQGGRTLLVMWARRPVPVRFHIRALDDDSEQAVVRLRYDGTAGVPLTEIEMRPREEDLQAFAGRWYAVDAPGALAADRFGNVMVEGSPVIVAIEGGPRTVWIQVRGRYWFLG